ncbi:hypothetical protein LXA43DRAFT_1102183 [Ganoderma leucocontextum]|nr:hypothetical protein LXA43DRAFT_1102183 [Ganoderma leucocontextum]
MKGTMDPPPHLYSNSHLVLVQSVNITFLPPPFQASARRRGNRDGARHSQNAVASRSSSSSQIVKNRSALKEKNKCYSFVVCILTENLQMVKKQVTPTSLYYRYRHMRAPEAPEDANGFIAGFYAVNLAFHVDVTARGDDLLAPLVAVSLREHMEAKGLQLRAIEGQEPHAINTTTPMDGWQFLYVKSVGRSNQYGGAEWHVMTRPNVYECQVKDAVRSAEKLPQFNPPLSGKLLMMISPTHHILVGPLPSPPGPQPGPISTPLHPHGILHTCIGLRAWPCAAVKPGPSGSLECLSECEENIDDSEDEDATASGSGPEQPQMYISMAATSALSPLSTLLTTIPPAIPPAIPPTFPPAVPPVVLPAVPPAVPSSVPPAVPSSVPPEVPSSVPPAIPSAIPSAVPPAVLQAAVPPAPSLPSIVLQPGSVSEPLSSTGQTDDVDMIPASPSSSAADTVIVTVSDGKPVDEDQQMRLLAPTVDLGGRGFWHMMLRLVKDPTNHTRYRQEGVSIRNFTPEGLMTSYPLVTIGEGIGPGPARAVFARALQCMLDMDGRYFTKTDDGYYTPLIPSVPLTEDHRHIFRACGYMMRQALIWDYPILPLSPLALAYLVGGLSAAIEPLFVHSVTPEVAKRLATWPPPRVNNELVVEWGKDPMTFIIEALPNTQPAHIRPLSDEGVRLLTPEITVALLFQCSKSALEGFQGRGIFMAIQDTLNYELGEPTDRIELYKTVLD